MRRNLVRALVASSFFALCWLGRPPSHSQEPQFVPGAVPGQAAAPGTLTVAPTAEPIPQGVEVQARGPVHEAFATPTSEPKPTGAVPKKPPAPIEELPPEERPEGDVSWISGYWAWDDDRHDYLWVSGCWRVKPEGKDWVPGYWREQGAVWQWVPGFWANAATREAPTQQVTYYPEPPAPPQVAPPGDPPSVDMLYVPGHWFWFGNHYSWRAGYWTRGRPGYVYVGSHYRWTPSGHVFVAGYWDLAVARRGVLYAPVVIAPHVVVTSGFVYTPYYAVPDTLMMDALFVRPATCHYYFGDYYGPRYRTLGFESSVVYGRRHYDPIVVYQRWSYRDNPRWHDTQISLVIARDSGRAPVPVRTLAQQRTNVTNVTNITNVTNVTNVNGRPTGLAPGKAVLEAQGAKTVPVDPTARTRIRASSQQVQQVAAQQRQTTETAQPPGTQSQARPRIASYNMPAPTAPTGPTPRSADTGPGTLGSTVTPPGGRITPPGNPASVTKGPLPTTYPSSTKGPVITTKPPAAATFPPAKQGAPATGNPPLTKNAGPVVTKTPPATSTPPAAPPGSRPKGPDVSAQPKGRPVPSRPTDPRKDDGKKKGT
jgi:hypothetical protein